MEKYHTTLGIVINKRTLKENDFLITLLTPKDGKIIAIAKGAKSVKSSRLGSLQLGNVIKASLYNKNDYLWISETKTLKPFLQHDKNLAQLNLLFYFLEIVNNLIADNQQIEGIYETSQRIIDAINNNLVNQYIKNEISFLEILGFGISQDILTNFQNKDYKKTQKLIKSYFESIIEKPIESNKLFN
jgi:DNA repair protein RecO (recombination protein O)